MRYETRDGLLDTGIFILRLGLGLMFIWHGWPKISGGPHFWHMIGMATSHLGIHFAPTFWGFMAAFAEFGGGILLCLGLLTRIAAVLLLVDMIVAASMHLGTGQGFAMASHAIEDGIVFLSLIFIGAGKASLDYLIARRRAG